MFLNFLNYLPSISEAFRNTSPNKIIHGYLGSRGITAVSFAIVFHGINDRCRRGSRDNIPSGCLRRRVASHRVASRRVAPWRRKIREGRVSLILSFTLRPFAAGPRPPSIIHPWRLRIYFGHPPRALSARLGVLMYRRARIRITPRKTRWSMFRDRLERVADAYSRMG